MICDYNLDPSNFDNKNFEVLYEQRFGGVNLRSIEEEKLDEYILDFEPYWVPLFPEYSIYRFLSVDNHKTKIGESRDVHFYRPIILINGYQSNRTTWNNFAQQLWNSGFRSVFALEPEHFSANLQEMFEILDASIKSILTSLYMFSSVTLIGHSLGGILARNYVKHTEMVQSASVSLLITLATPHYGVVKYLYSFESIFRLLIKSETVELFKQEEGLLKINKMHQKGELLKVTMINIQGFMKRLGGTDGIIKPEPVSEMINYVVHKNHFRINKSIKVYNILKDFLFDDASIYKIQLDYVGFPNINILNKIYIYFIVKIQGKEEQKYPVAENIEIQEENNEQIKPTIIFAGKFDPLDFEKQVTISLYRKRRLIDDKLVEKTFIIHPAIDEPIFHHQTMENQLVLVNISVASYNLSN